MSETVAVVGAGTMGVGIAYVFAAAGYGIALVEPDEARFAGALSTLAEAAAAGVKRGKLNAERGRTLVDSVSRYTEAVDLPRGLALAIETVPERAELKA